MLCVARHWAKTARSTVPLTWRSVFCHAWIISLVRHLTCHLLWWKGVCACSYELNHLVCINDDYVSWYDENVLLWLLFHAFLVLLAPLHHTRCLVMCRHNYHVSHLPWASQRNTCLQKLPSPLPKLWLYRPCFVGNYFAIHESSDLSKNVLQVIYTPEFCKYYTPNHPIVHYICFTSEVDVSSAIEAKINYYLCGIYPCPISDRGNVKTS